MIAMVLLVAANSAAADFRADFPEASVIESPSGGKLRNASRFEARGLGASPAEASRAFLSRYGAAFGLSPRQQLVLRDATPAGQLGQVRFERQIDRLPVFEGDLIVGVNASNSVILVNSADIPSRNSGRFHLSRRTAIRAATRALPGLVTSDSPRATRGWKAIGPVLRAVWRVDLVADSPPGDWRSYVDAETGKVALRINLRATSDALVPGAGTGPR